MIEKIERMSLGDVWKHESYDFTQWLQENIDVLSNAIDLELSNPEKEQAQQVTIQGNWVKSVLKQTQNT